MSTEKMVNRLVLAFCVWYLVLVFLVFGFHSYCPRSLAKNILNRNFLNYSSSLIFSVQELNVHPQI